MYALSSYNVGFLNNSQLVVILVGRLIRGVTSVAPWRLRDESQIRELARKKMPEEVCSSRTVDQTKLSRLILLLHCTAIAGYNTLVIAT